jgi:hypothetical protein
MLKNRIVALLFVLGLGLSGSCTGQVLAPPFDLGSAYRDQVDRRLEVPADEAQRYGELARDALAGAGLVLDAAQYLALVDRDPKVQAIFIYRMAPGIAPELIGASPVSTGRGGEFDHFQTPLGVFEHTPSNPDFRAEGTRNENGIRGYGVAGMRVFDFGWQEAQRLWGRGGTSTMRLQMHATDPDLLESRLGSPQSKGCVRIPATLNHLLDRFGVLDAAYLEAQAVGDPLWVLPAGQTPVADSGRYLIVVDTQRNKRPAWAAPAAPVPTSGPRRRAP